jgi:hypothetical protein
MIMNELKQLNNLHFSYHQLDMHHIFLEILQKQFLNVLQIDVIASSDMQ